jgi:hypothetical protein
MNILPDCLLTKTYQTIQFWPVIISCLCSCTKTMSESDLGHRCPHWNLMALFGLSLLASRTTPCTKNFLFFLFFLPSGLLTPYSLALVVNLYPVPMPQRRPLLLFSIRLLINPVGLLDIAITRPRRPLSSSAHDPQLSGL